jgi:hypothetical protein
MFVLQVTRGGVVSTTVTVKLQVTVELPAVQTTLLVPNRKPVPLGGTQVTGTAPLALEAVTLKVTGVSPPVHSAMMFVGQLIVGGQSRLRTVMICTHDALLVQSSVTVCVRNKVLPGPTPFSSNAI